MPASAGKVERWRSRPGKGSIFQLTLERASAYAPEPVATLIDRPTKARILLLDDEPDVLAAMEMLLLSWGFAVGAFGSLRDAPDALDRGLDPALIISDFRLPGGETGVTAIERLRTASRKPLPTILITAETSPEQIIEAKASGLLVLQKPLVKSSLRAALNTFLSQDA